MRTVLPDSSLSPQNASTFEDVVQVPSAYQKTVPIEAGESQQSESTVWSMWDNAGARALPGIAEGKASLCGVLVKGAGDWVLRAAYMYPLTSLLSLVQATA